jgi:hypothetical protein
VLLGVALALGVIACGREGVSGSAAALSLNGNGSATLNWTPVTKNTDGTPATVAGYRLYYGTSASSLSPLDELANPNVTTYLVSNLPSGHGLQQQRRRERQVQHRSENDSVITGATQRTSAAPLVAHCTGVLGRTDDEHRRTD